MRRLIWTDDAPWRPLFAADGGGGNGGGAGGAGGAGGDAGGAGGDAGGGGDGAGGDWLAGANDTSREIAARNGFKSLDQALTGYHDAATKLGVSPDQLLTIPGAEADDEAWSGIYGRLGRPDEATGYQFPSLQGAKPETDEVIAKSAHALGLTPRQATQLRDSYYQQAAADRDAHEEWIAEGVQKVKAGFLERFGGDMADAEYAKVNRAISWLSGGDGKIAEEMEQSGLSGNPEFVERLRQFGELVTGDAKLMGDGGGHGNGFDSPAAAQAEIDRMKEDKETAAALFDRHHANHAKVAARYKELAAVAYPEAA